MLKRKEKSTSVSDDRKVTAFSADVSPLDVFKNVRNRPKAMDPAVTNVYNSVTGSTETRTLIRGTLMFAEKLLTSAHVGSAL